MDEYMLPMMLDYASERGKVMATLAATAHDLRKDSDEYKMVIRYMQLILDATIAAPEEKSATVSEFPKGVQ